MVVARRVGHAARTVIRGDAACGRVALIEGNDDSVVAGLPFRGRSDLVDNIAYKLVALRDQPVRLRCPGVARVQAPRRSAVHVVTFIAYDVAERGNFARA